MKRQIFLDKPAKDKICDDFNVTYMTLWSALNFRTQSSLARMLRKVAIERGGVERSPKNFQTVHNTKDKTMTQVFSDQVKIEVSFATGRVLLLVDEQQLSVTENPTITEFYTIQQSAMEMAEKLMDS